MSSRHKAPSAKRCIKTSRDRERGAAADRCQKAPSAKRCIKTSHSVDPPLCNLSCVRKHRAPKGALRQRLGRFSHPKPRMGQRAPSAIRCIKTRRQSTWPTTPGHARKHRAPFSALRHGRRHCLADGAHARKHRAPYGALRRTRCGVTGASASAPESTERHTVH